MRKLFMAAAALAGLVLPSVAQAGAPFSVTIVGTTGVTGATNAASCVTGAPGPLSSPGCQKSTLSRHARCLWLTDSAAAQDNAAKEGKLGFVFKIDPTKTNSFDSQAVLNAGAVTDGNNFRYTLTAESFAGGAPVKNPVPGTVNADVPDVDVVFYVESLGTCAGAKPDSKVPDNAAFGAPIQPPTSIFYPPASAMGFGDEVNIQFPSSRYLFEDPNTGKEFFKTTTKMWAIVTVVGGPNTVVKFACSSCANGWISPA